MCGICGILDLSGRSPSREALQGMTDAIAHRGPDGEGVFISGPAGLGHRRLAILDLSPTGAQPMRTGDGRFSISYNGELYNFRELRQDLERRGHSFYSTSDTEVVLKAYAEWGERCVERFNGMFAFAVWDDRRRELFLARDRYGIKPLYYAFFGRTFLFGSEQKAILAHPEARREIDFEGLLEYFTFQNFFTDKTLSKGVRLFPPGCTAILGADEVGGELPLRRYWDFDFTEPDTHLKEEEYLEELDYLFNNAVKRQMVSDVELGAYLSGGIDSGSISAVAAGEQSYIKSFTCGFDLSSASGLELTFDERATAERMSYMFKTEHYEMVLKAGDMERCLPDLTRHLEEPRVGQSYPNFYAAKLASRFVKVVLSGSGGDELFGGYPWRYYRALVCDDFEHYVDQYYVFWQRLIPNRLIQQVFAPVWPEVKHVWTRDIFCDVFGDRRTLPCTPEQAVNNSLYFEAKTFLHGLLVVEDKLSMAHGLENRVPFLDNDLVDFATKVPVSMKLNNLHQVVSMNENEVGPKFKRYFQKTNDGKRLLRRLASRFVPEDITMSVKQGFSAPDASWFKGDSIRFVAETLIKNDAAIYEFLDPDAVRRLVMEHLEGTQNRRLLIWSLLNVEQWLRQFRGAA